MAVPSDQACDPNYIEHTPFCLKNHSPVTWCNLAQN